MPLVRDCLFVLLLSLSFIVAAAEPAKFETVRLAAGVYAVIRKDPPGLGVESNSLFIIGESDVIVVDAQSNLATTKEVLAALRKLTAKPVKYVVNTHWHDDHIVGNQVYRDAFPGVEFIAHANSRAYLETTGIANREQFHQAIPGFIEQVRSLLRNNKNFRGEPLTEEERASYLSDIALGEGYLTVPDGFRPVLPTITLDSKLTLYQGERAVEVLYLGRGHTSGDIIVYLPQDRIVAAGDLVIWPIPLVGSDQSHVGDWSATLEKLRALRPAVIVPGHGPVLHDDAYLKLMADAFAAIRQQTEAAVARGETLEQTRKSVKLDELRKMFAGDSRLLAFIFDNYVAGPAVAAAFRDASAKP